MLRTVRHTSSWAFVLRTSLKTQIHFVLVQNGRSKAQQSDDRGSGPFDASTSSSEDEQEPPALPPRKERSSTEPPPYSINNSYLNSLDRKSTVSLGRKPEREAFYNDADALHVGVLHQRRVLAVWQKRYCKAKNESLLVYRQVFTELGRRVV